MDKALVIQHLVLQFKWSKLLPTVRTRWIKELKVPFEGPLPQSKQLKCIHSALPAVTCQNVFCQRSLLQLLRFLQSDVVVLLSTSSRGHERCSVYTYSHSSESWLSSYTVCCIKKLQWDPDSRKQIVAFHSVISTVELHMKTMKAPWKTWGYNVGA